MTVKAAQQSTAPTDTNIRLLEKLAKKKQAKAAAGTSSGGDEVKYR